MEAEPFLQDHRQASPASPHTEAVNHSAPFNANQRARFFGCIFAFKFCIQFANGLLELPMIRLIERAICRSSLGRPAVDNGEAACKAPIVQDKLALMLGYKWALDTLPCRLFYLWATPTID